MPTSNKQYSIQDLTEGNVSAKNDGKSLELLKQLLELAFPNTDTDILGLDTYYFRSYNFKNEWDSSQMSPNLPTQSIHDFQLPLPNIDENSNDYKNKMEQVVEIIESDNNTRTGNSIRELLDSKGSEQDENVYNAAAKYCNEKKDLASAYGGFIYGAEWQSKQGKKHINYASLIEGKMYPVIYTVLQSGVKVFEPKWISGKDLTEPQIKYLYDLGYFNNNF